MELLFKLKLIYCKLVEKTKNQKTKKQPSFNATLKIILQL